MFFLGGGGFGSRVGVTTPHATDCQVDQQWMMGMGEHGGGGYKGWERIFSPLYWVSPLAD